MTGRAPKSPEERAKWALRQRERRGDKRESEAADRLENALALTELQERDTYGRQRTLLRKADVGYYMALFPDEDIQSICDRFHIHRNTLAKWKQDDIFAAGFARGIAARRTEQDEAAKEFFKSRILAYVGRLDALAMQDDDRGTALKAVTRILETQGTLETQKQSVVQVAIAIQRGIDQAATAPQISIGGKVVRDDGKAIGTEDGSAGGHSKPTGEIEAPREDVQRDVSLDHESQEAQDHGR